MNTHKKLILAALTPILVLCTDPAPAHALDVGKALVFSCTGNGNVGDHIEDQARTECKAKKGTRPICDVLSGGTAACYQRSPQSVGDDDCRTNRMDVTIEAGMSLPTGWSVTGAVSAEMVLESKKTDRKECQLTGRNADGRAGKYVSETFKVKGTMSFAVSGNFTLTGPTGTVNVSASAGCSSAVNAGDGYTIGESSKCEAVEATISVETEPTGYGTTSGEDRAD